MPATVTLSTTTLSDALDSSARSIKVASTTGFVSGTRLFVDRELMSVTGFGVATSAYSTVNVLRGVDGTSASPHSSGVTITFGRADQFYSTDPVGAPALSILVSPYINVITGDVWYAQGDDLPAGTTRWWQKQTATYDQGALGVRITTLTPTSST